MKKLSLLAFLLLGACSTAQTTAFQTGLTNFTSNIVAVNAAIASVDAQLYQNCNSIQAVGQALLGLAGATNSPAAVSGVQAANAGISAWCQAPPVDLASAVTTTASIVTAVKNSLAAAKKGN